MSNCNTVAECILTYHVYNELVLIFILSLTITQGVDSKQPKLERKLVSALSGTKGLFRLFRFYTETESFGVSIEPKQREKQPNQCDREHILLFCPENFGLFRFVLVCFSVVSFLYRNREFRCFTNRRPTETVLQRAYFGIFQKIQGCFKTVFFQNSSVCFSYFNIGSKHLNKPPKQTEIFYIYFHETNRNTTETDLVSVCFGLNRNFCCLFRGHLTITTDRTYKFHGSQLTI